MPITILLLLPILGALAVALAPVRDPQQLRRLAVGASLLPLAWTFWLWFGASAAGGGRIWSERHEWIPALGIEYHLGADGISLLFILLAGILTPFALAVSRGITEKARAYFALILVLQAMLYGTFTALNFPLWFLFWELSLIPAFLLIRLWGRGDAPAAALKFFIMTLAGSLAMLAAFLALFIATGSFDFHALAGMAAEGRIGGLLADRFPMFGAYAACVVFLGVLLGLAVKVPMFPLHTWLPDAYTQAPTPFTMLLTGVMSKMGVYGLLRILGPIFPEQIQAAITPLLWLAVATIVLSALAALRQTDIKRMLAYSSVNHLGYCLLGVFAAIGAAEGANVALNQSAALGGVMLQVFNHGIIAGALFCFVGFIELRSNGGRGLDDFGGLRKNAPVFAGLMGIALFASLGLPGLSGFVGEFLIFKGAFALAPAATAVAATGLLITAVFLLRIQRRVFHGPLNERWTGFADLDTRERLIVAPAIALILILGVWPRLLLDIFNPDLLTLIQHLPLS